MRRTVIRPSQGTLSRQWLTDHIRPGVRILFVGINPGLRSAATGHHFAGYSNRFWRLLFESKLTPELFTHQDDWRLPDWGLGLTNIIQRPSAGINVLKLRDYVAGRKRLIATVKRYRPHVVALLGVTIYRTLFPEYRTGRVSPGCNPRPWPTGLFLSCPILAVGMPIIHIEPCSRRFVHCARCQTSLFEVRRRNRSREGIRICRSKFLTSYDIHAISNWDMDCCISQVSLVGFPSTVEEDEAYIPCPARLLDLGKPHCPPGATIIPSIDSWSDDRVLRRSCHSRPEQPSRPFRERPGPGRASRGLGRSICGGTLRPVL